MGNSVSYLQKKISSVHIFAASQEYSHDHSNFYQLFDFSISTCIMMMMMMVWHFPFCRSASNGLVT
jgi:hypothetical protein